MTRFIWSALANDFLSFFAGCHPCSPRLRGVEIEDLVASLAVGQNLFGTFLGMTLPFGSLF